MIRSPGAEPRDQVKRKRALQGCNHRRGITWWGLIRADVGSAGESTRSRAASSLGCCFGCCLSPTSDEKTPACLENPLPCFPCATQAHPLVVALYSRGSRPEFADAFLRQITTSNRDDFLSKARAGTGGSEGGAVVAKKLDYALAPDIESPAFVPFRANPEDANCRLERVDIFLHRQKL